MYACILENGRRFFTGVCTLSNTTASFHDPPPRPHKPRIDSPPTRAEAKVNGADRMPSAPLARSAYEVTP